MVNDKQLIPGAFYWVIPEVDPDAQRPGPLRTGNEWQDGMQRLERCGRDAVEFHGFRRLVGLAGAVGWHACPY